MRREFLGSTLALIFGVLYFISSLTNNGAGLIAGPAIILGSIAYRSAKKRNLNQTKRHKTRIIIESILILIVIAIYGLHNDLLVYVQSDPVPYFIIPLWIAITYIYIATKNVKKQSNEITTSD